MPDSKMLKDAFAKRYPPETNAHVTIRECGVALCRQHLASGLGDKNAEQRLCSVNDAVYWQQLSEILLADQLGKAGLHHSIWLRAPISSSSTRGVAFGLR